MAPIRWQGGVKEESSRTSLTLAIACCWGTCWLGNWQSTEVMLLAYCAISFLMDFSTAGGMRPDTLVMMS
ncbi:hypothetical protein EYF80_002953 [Liparis tanakae]|uniref:Uncharacterized protein n=1 Tax=Liparis tanakae TaxID=230148 RepID=A0A4Z2J9I1_9TELE|nr:hypothetical protein EYF80_002953 [Liparis tanakae]